MKRRADRAPSGGVSGLPPRGAVDSRARAPRDAVAVSVGRTAGRLMRGGMWSILPRLPAERSGHKADYVLSSEGGARGKKDGWVGGYVESWQGVRKRGEGRGSGLKSSRLENS